jgi:pimeloyl-ACP methyl ester carboxylesterase
MADTQAPERPEMAAVWRRGRCPAADRVGCGTAVAASGAAFDLGGPQRRRHERAAADRAVPGPRRHLAWLPPLWSDRPRDRSWSGGDPRLDGFERNQGHALSAALAARGVETWAIDIRGHGVSGTRGDIGYVGQLEDDLADFVAVVRKTHPDVPLTLIGHSAGGGFALRVAASPIQNLFVRTVLLAPYLGYNAPTNQPNSGGWASADIPRFIGLAILRRIGIDCCGSLPTLAFAVPPNSQAIQTGIYSDRLMRNFANHPDYRGDFAAATHPMTIYAGADDELMISDKYAEAVRGIQPAIDVKLIDGINHMGIVTAPKAVSAIADDVATRGAAGS